MSNRTEVKYAKNVIGLMSGTSIDGIDAAFLKTDGLLHVETGEAITIPYGVDLRKTLSELVSSGKQSKTVEEQITVKHAEVISQLLTKTNTAVVEIDLIGFHGHTIYHKPAQRKTLQIGDGEKLTFQNNSFDAITAGFGIRNFENMRQGLSECYRTLKKDGILLILEPSIPSMPVLKQIYIVYFSYLLPLLGKIVSRDKNAYQYLRDSVKAFPSQSDFLQILEEIGFKKCKHIPVSFGIVSLYYAIK